MKWRWVWKEPVCFSALTEWKKWALCAQREPLIAGHLRGGKHKNTIETEESQIYLWHKPRLLASERYAYSVAWVSTEDFDAGMGSLFIYTVIQD